MTASATEANSSFIVLAAALALCLAVALATVCDNGMKFLLIAATSALERIGCSCGFGAAAFDAAAGRFRGGMIPLRAGHLNSWAYCCVWKHCY